MEANVMCNICYLKTKRSKSSRKQKVKGLTTCNLNAKKSKSSYKQKLAGFARYLATLSNGTDQDFNKVAICMHIRAMTSFHMKDVDILACLLIIYAQNLSSPHPDIVNLNTHVFQQKHKLELIYMIIFIVIGLISLRRIFPVTYSLCLLGAITVLGYVHVLYALKRIERKIYRNITPTPKSQLELKDRFDTSKELQTVAPKIHFILQNVPPHTINRQHITNIKNLSFHFSYHQYQVSDDYHAIAPYPISTFSSPKEVKQLLNYLGSNVKNSPHNYI